jgi:demethylmenaquinone methyltransferase/2-methoxy-6-polyprenyl-1,4-benzoquinol methylase
MAVAQTMTPPGAVRAIFDGIAPAYDRFNAWASLGLHQQWRKALVWRIPPGARVLDIATGTGDVAFLAAERGHEVAGLDFAEGMLMIAREKDKTGRIRWVQGMADRLPFSDRSFGCVTSAFALRNLRPSLDGVFKESFRILRTGGKALHLDFGRPQSAMIRWVYRLYLAFGIPLIGQVVCGARWPKGYLEGTIREFCEPEELEGRLRAVGFSEVRHTPLTGGIVQLYEGTKAC